MTLRTSTVEIEGTYQGSKYLKYQVLCSALELRDLFERCSPSVLYHLTGLSDGKSLERDLFIQEYDHWIQMLQEGKVPSDQQLKSILAAGLSKSADGFWKQELANGRYIIKMAKPIIQIQAHFFTYSSIDKVFRPMTMGHNSIFWGLQFSFPQIYQDPKTMELLKSDQTENAKLFQIIKQWVKDETRPTPFLVEGKKVNVPIRLGKSCFSWIHKHPQLKEIGIYAN